MKNKIKCSSKSTWVSILANSLKKLPFLYYPTRFLWRKYLSPFLKLIKKKSVERRAYRELADRIHSIEDYVSQHEDNVKGQEILLINLTSSPAKPSFMQLSQLIFAWALRLRGHKVKVLFCNQSMSLCPQASQKGKVLTPSCEQCQRYRSNLFKYFTLVPLGKFQEIANKKMSLDYVIHSVRHTLKRFNLRNDSKSKIITQMFEQSARSIAHNFESVLDDMKPLAVIAFNGVIYPEWTFRDICLRRNIPVFTYESGFRENSLFLSSGLAPMYDFDLRQGSLSEEEDDELDSYLERRFAGKFKMGFTQFWGDMKEVSPDLKDKIDRHQEVVTIFTNSVYDTSTIFSNSIFESLFEWLEQLKQVLVEFPNVLFIVRAHPDEFRGGKTLDKRYQKSDELIEDWLRAEGFFDLSNFLFVSPLEFVSSYELLKISKFCMVYNSTVGLESLIMGVPVVAAGSTKYSKLMYFKEFSGPREYFIHLKKQLNDAPCMVSEVDVAHARALFYDLFFVHSVDFSKYLERRADGSKLVGLRHFKHGDLEKGSRSEIDKIMEPFDSLMRNS